MQDFQTQQLENNKKDAGSSQTECFVVTCHKFIQNNNSDRVRNHESQQKFREIAHNYGW